MIILGEIQNGCCSGGKDSPFILFIDNKIFKTINFLVMELVFLCQLMHLKFVKVSENISELFSPSAIRNIILMQEVHIWFSYLEVVT